ncbi:MAG TPA: 3-phosphoserine/phosphohydroxythreonine transaminase [Lacipirellulaceae bacterium]|nr:3-phosphoserine/phosphohydroxythreonine transaminase [Lacipirellulaceae bacterium]
MTHRVYNFSAGPSVLPLPVLQEVHRDMLALPGAGASILEISHRSAAFMPIIEGAEAALRRLLAIPDDYAVLFVQGGSRLQFSMVPMNLLEPGGVADYILTGSWGKDALKEAKKEGKARVAWDGAKTNYDRLPAAGDLDLEPQAAYVHYTDNETIQGVEFSTAPDAGSVPLVCDASSNFLSRPMDVRKYGLVYACAQKNAGPSGVTVVIVRRELLKRANAEMPGYLHYGTHAENGSMWNTPPTFAIYVLKLITEWLERDIGGLAAMQERNREKAALLYDVLDSSGGFYEGHAQRECRSQMNVTFRLSSEELTAQFVGEAKKRGLHELKGHRSVGGIRASIYNAMPREGVAALRDFMVEFREQNQK